MIGDLSFDDIEQLMQYKSLDAKPAEP